MFNIVTKVKRINWMKRSAVSIYKNMRACKLIFRGIKQYKSNIAEYKRLNCNSTFKLKHKNNFPCYTDRYQRAGTLGAYFWQDLWAAQLIAKENPTSHYDIGSRIDGFIAHLASFRDNIKLIDVRPLENVIPGVEFIQADATNLYGIGDESVESISALCSLEHFGLGRYGDPIDPDACFKAIASIKRVVIRGGNIYISVPIGREHLEFDAHRVFYAESIIKQFHGFELIEFSCIHAHDKVIEKNVPVHKYDKDVELGGARFGLFHFRKNN